MYVCIIFRKNVILQIARNYNPKCIRTSYNAAEVESHLCIHKSVTTVIPLK